MLSLSKVQNIKVFTTKPNKNADELALKRIGKVHQVVFAPNGKKIIGFMVKRPDVVGMIKREDVFLAFDAFDTCDDGIYCTNKKTGIGSAAIKRLGFDWNTCIMWAGMDVITTSGKRLGYVVDFDFNTATGMVETFKISNGGTAKALIGAIYVPASALQGHRNQTMIVADGVATQDFSGGFAAKAGEAVGAAQVAGAKAGKKVAKAADKALEKGSYSFGRALGKARRAVTEATQLDPEVTEIEAQEVKISSPDTDAKIVDGQCSVATKTSQETTSQAAKTSSTKSVRTKEKTSSDDATAKAARALGRNLSKTRGMFAAFKEEFDKSSK
ncbi:PRC-barrel domain-containing protein [Atopobium fossor]|uniref:PRC-barrel domain-containing protein n=1 Tax=Atopobium fossor TaxID=39487 RepID=UPI0004221090|nr:PRC-barrel domain-containing protein [Atopobium fossor]